MRAYLLSLALLLATTLPAPDADAQTVYKFVDKNGNLVYSDTPVAGSEVVEIKPVSTLPMAAPSKPQEIKQEPAVSRPYHVVISTPSNDAVFSNDPEPVVITGSSDPSLRPTHDFRLNVNGETGRPQKSPVFTLAHPERGSYTVMLEIVDSNLHVVAHSEAITFHVRHHSKLFKKPTAPGPGKQ